MKERLDRERRAVLKDLGIKVKKDEDPASKIEEYKASKEERRKQREAQAKELDEAKKSLERLSASEVAVKIYADAEFAALSAEQQAIVTTAAGDNHAERLRTIAIMKASAPKDAPKAPPAPIPAPAQTAPTSAPAPAATPSTPVDVKAEYQRLQGVNPYLAAGFLLANQGEYLKNLK